MCCWVGVTDDVDGSDDNDDYECMRQRNIEANNRMLAELGLMGVGVPMSTSGTKTGRTSQAPKKRVKRSSASLRKPADATEYDAVPRRRSLRTRGGKSDEYCYWQKYLRVKVGFLWKLLHFCNHMQLNGVVVLIMYDVAAFQDWFFHWQLFRFRFCLFALRSSVVQF